MATGGVVLDSVMKFARPSGVFVSPGSPDDKIDPAFSSMSDADYAHVWQRFHLALKQDGIITEIPLNQMRQAQTWGELSDLAFDNQPV